MAKSSPSRTAGAVVRKVQIGGVEYELSTPDLVRKAADEEAVLIARRLDMMPAVVRACEALPEDKRATWMSSYLDKMVCGIASNQEWLAYYSSPWQDAFRFWHALAPEERAGRTLLDGVQWAYEVISGDDVSADDMRALRLAIRMVSQEDAVKNSSGSPPEGTPLHRKGIE
jgi:hypothetical protein